MTQQFALFLDRDGVINVDRGYVSQQEDFEFIEGIFTLCREAKSKGYLIFIITNQAGIARGYYSEQDFHRLTEWMKNMFVSQGSQIDAVYFSPYHPEHGIGEYKRKTDCRKPNPGMLLRAAREFNVDLRRSVLIGDKSTDIEAGLAAGVGCNILFIPSSGKQYDSDASTATGVITTLSDAILYL